MSKTNSRKDGEQLIHSAALSLTPYRGVTFTASKGKQWKASLLRAGQNLYLGEYTNPLDAAKAVDNANHHTRHFSRRHSPFNFPQEWDGPAIQQPNSYTVKALARLREKFPGLEADIALKTEGTYSEQLERAADRLSGGVKLIVDQLCSELRLAAGRIRMLEGAEKLNVEEIERLKRTIKGLENMGGQQFFKKVGDGTLVPATGVEDALG